MDSVSAREQFTQKERVGRCDAPGLLGYKSRDRELHEPENRAPAPARSMPSKVWTRNAISRPWRLEEMALHFRVVVKLGGARCDFSSGNSRDHFSRPD